MKYKNFTMQERVSGQMIAQSLSRKAQDAYFESDYHIAATNSFYYIYNGKNEICNRYYTIQDIEEFFENLYDQMNEV